LLRQKKVSKEKATRMPLASCASRIYRGFSKGTFCPFDNVRLTYPDRRIMMALHTFDDSNIRWNKLAGFGHLE
jgi:hypothetical protein